MSRLPSLPPIPDKHFFKIGEVADLVGVRTTVLRFWESEFTQIRPTKTPNGHRVYARADVELLRRIRVLVHDRGYTIAGARSLLQQGETAVTAVLDAAPLEVAQERNAAEARLVTVTQDNTTLTAQLAQLEKRLRDATDEAFFWRRRAMAEEKRLRDLVSRLEPLVGAMKLSTKSRRELETD